MTEASETHGNETKRTTNSVRLAHIGIAVVNLSEAREKFAAILGSTPSPIEEIASEGVRVSFFELENCRIELLESTRPESPIARFLAAGRTGVHHLAFSTAESSLSTLIESFRARKISVLDETPRRAAEGSEAIFIHPRDAEGVLVEFVEPETRADP